MIELMSSKPNVVVRPQPQQKQIRQPQIIVIPQSMLANNGMKTIFSITSHDSTKQAELTRMPRPPVAIIKRPIEASKPIALKRPCSSPSNDYSSEDDCRSSCSGGEDSNAAKIRKRANLDHLSTEEKLMRRKLKNRVAAQNARDKKKVKMDEMEETIRLLEQKNRALTKQNEQLQAENQRLLAENETLKNNNTLTTIMIKDEQMPYSPESLPPQSHSPPLSDEDDEMLTSVIPIDMSKQTRSTVFGTAKSGLEACSSVSNRLLAPAARTKSVSGSRASTIQSPASHGAGTVGLSAVDLFVNSPGSTATDGSFSDGGDLPIGEFLVDVCGDQPAAEEKGALVGLAPTIPACQDLDDLLGQSFSGQGTTCLESKDEEDIEDQMTNTLSDQFDKYLLQFNQSFLNQPFNFEKDIDDDNSFEDFLFPALN